jgi:hypothetical protein
MGSSGRHALGGGI